MKKFFILFAILIGAGMFQADAQNSQVVVINEVAWAGTLASPNDEWIELFNNSDRPVNLAGWVLQWEGRNIHFAEVAADVDTNTREIRNTVIPARGYYLLERTDDTTVNNVEADLIYTGSLRNSGEKLELLDNRGVLIDTANSDAEDGWIAGNSANGNVPYASMERITARTADQINNWASNNGSERRGIDANGGSINGTPKFRNSAR